VTRLTLQPRLPGTARALSGIRVVDSPFATQGSIPGGRAQHAMTLSVASNGATLRGMEKREWADYWRRVCAPTLKIRKERLGRGVPEHEIAAYVRNATGKPSKRALVQHWLQGTREPFISQFFALCSKMEIDPLEVLKLGGGKRKPPGIVLHSGVASPKTLVRRKRERKTE
jgi:hypothetical protein